MESNREIQLREFRALRKLPEEQVLELARKHGVDVEAYKIVDFIEMPALCATLAELATIPPGNHTPQWERLS